MMKIKIWRGLASPYTPPGKINVIAFSVQLLILLTSASSCVPFGCVPPASSSVAAMVVFFTALPGLMKIRYSWLNATDPNLHIPCGIMGPDTARDNKKNRPKSIIE